MQAVLQPSRRSIRRFHADRFLALLAFVLLGYAVMGKGFAYIGIPPLYIGEIALLFGALAFALTPPAWQVLSSRRVWPLLAFMLWGAARTLPYVRSYGLDALRDAVVWVYALFALLVAGFLIAKPSRLQALVRYYRRFVLIFVVVLIPAYLLTRLPGFQLPLHPGTEVPLIRLKGGDTMVHLAGVTTSFLSGLTKIGLVPALLLGTEVIVGAVYNRGGLLAFLAAVGLVMTLRPRSRRTWRVLGAGFLIVVVLATSGVQFTARAGRMVSASQLVTNALSIVGRASDENLEGTRAWRLLWWKQIVDYTVFGEHFWTGKGYGINLADDDGFQVNWDASLRSPHNGHLTILARSGVPGLLVWLAVQFGWAWAIFRQYLRALRSADRIWRGLFLFLLALWAAFMTNASFDVFLEGPMGGIWFWTVYGVGLAALWIYPRYPNALADRQGGSVAGAEEWRQVPKESSSL